MMGSRRRSNDLDRLLDRLNAGEEPEATGDLSPYLHPARVARASLSRTVGDGVARSHISALREDRARQIVLVPPAGRYRLRVVAAGLVAVIVLVLGAGSAIAASDDALPGDALYGLKRAVERISLAMHRDSAERAALHLRFAQRRLDEIQLLVAAGENPSGTVDAFDSELNAAEQDAEQAIALGGDAEALLAHVQAMIDKHLLVLGPLLDKVPEQARNSIQRAIDNARNADQKAQHGRTENGEKGGAHGKPTSPPAHDGHGP